MEKNDIESGLDCYDPERRVFGSISQRKPPTLGEFDLALILRWKLGMFTRAHGELVRRQLAAINEAIIKAGMAGSEISAMESLSKIAGIKTAVASAILTVCYPNKFSIIDVRVLNKLNLTPMDASGWDAHKYWREYMPHVQSFATKHELSLRDADRTLWGQSVYEDLMTRINTCKK